MTEIMTLIEFKEMAFLFNKMSLKEKIIFLKENNDKLELMNDFNWWWIEAKDKIIDRLLIACVADVWYD